MKEHDLKTLPCFFEALWRGVKPFELRKNDRDYCTGDALRLREWSPDDGYSGRIVRTTITYVLDASFPEACKGLAEGFAILGLGPLTWIEGDVVLHTQH